MIIEHHSKRINFMNQSDTIAEFDRQHPINISGCLKNIRIQLITVFISIDYLFDVLSSSVPMPFWFLPLWPAFFQLKWVKCLSGSHDRARIGLSLNKCFNLNLWLEEKGVVNKNYTQSEYNKDTYHSFEWELRNWWLPFARIFFHDGSIGNWFQLREVTFHISHNVSSYGQYIETVIIKYSIALLEAEKNIRLMWRQTLCLVRVRSQMIKNTRNHRLIL